MIEQLVRECEALAGQISDDRAYLHRHAELSGQETETLVFIKRRLQDLSLPFEDIEDGGIITWIDAVRSGRTLLLRADIDALPVAESKYNQKTEKKVVSMCDTIAHVCGHDAHTAMLLAALSVLAAHTQMFSGRIVAVFERGEEMGFGVKAVLRYLLKAGISPDCCFALHVNADIQEGRISVNSGNVMSGAFGFDVTLHGSGGHSSRPDLCNNPTDCFVSIYQDLAALRMRYTDPYESFTYAVGLLQGSEKCNIIPDRVRFSCMGRFFHEEKTAQPFLKKALEVVEKDCALYDCIPEYSYVMQPTPSVYNAPELAICAGKWFRDALGSEFVTYAKPWMASETYGLYSMMYPSLLAFLGIQNDSGCGAPHHSPEFDLNGEQLYRGTQAIVVYAVSFLNSEICIEKPKDPQAIFEKYEDRI